MDNKVSLYNKKKFKKLKIKPPNQNKQQLRFHLVSFNNFDFPGDTMLSPTGYRVTF